MRIRHAIAGLGAACALVTANTAMAQYNHPSKANKLPCGTDATPPLPAGKCGAKTTAKAIVAGVIIGGANGNIGIAQLQVTSGSDLVFEEGLYLP